MKAYSIDLRERVVAAIDDGMVQANAVRTFRVSRATITRWSAQHRATGTLTPSVPSGQPALITAAHRPALLTQLATYPDATLAEHAARWNAAYGTSLSQWTMGRAIRRVAWTRKKSR